jgi:DNA (cytosine-5)-methyltransferase 1
MANTLQRHQQQAIAQPYSVGNTLTARMAKGFNTTLDEGQTPVLAMGIFGVGENPEVGHCLRAGASKADKHESTTYVVAPTITASNDPSRSPQSSEVTQQVAAAPAATMQVRRLTPTECERLQGFPDGYTNIPWRGKQESPDGPRYKALGNSMAVPVMRWIGERIKRMEEINNEQQ